MIKGRTSDTSGFFEFPIPADADTFQITCSYIGYETVTATYSDGQDEMVTIQLKAGALLPEVVVMAEGRRLRRYLTGGGQTFYHEQSSPAPVVEPLATPEVHIYPNPFTESVQLRLTLEQAGRLRLHLFNTQGELLQMSAHDLPAGPQELTFRLRDPQWPAGIYFLRLLDEHGEIMTRQLIKGH